MAAANPATPTGAETRAGDESPRRLPRLRRAWLIGPAAIAALSVVIRLVYGRGWEHYDAIYSLIWGGELAGGHKPPDIGALASPTEHPLANFVGMLLSPLRFAHQLALLELISVVSLAAIGYFAFRLGQTLFNVAVGAAFALILLTAPFLVSQTLESSSDVPFLALVLAAVALEAQRTRRGWQVMALLALAGLLRPEAWLLAAAYWLWLWPVLSPRARLGLAVLGAAPAVVWLGFDAWATGDPLKSLTGTQAAAAHIHRPTGLFTAVRHGPGDLVSVYGKWIAAGGLVGFLASLWLLRRRALLPAVVIALGCLAFVAIGTAQLSLISRYLFIPATMVALMCAVAAFGWLSLDPDGASGRWRRWWMIGGSVVFVVVAVGFGRQAADNLPGISRDAARTSRDDAALRLLLAQTPVQSALQRCGPLQTNDFRARPMVALLRGTHPFDYVLVHSRTAAHPPGIYLDNIRQPHSGSVASGFFILGRLGPWTLYDSCSVT